MKHTTDDLTHLHAESPAAFDELANVPLILAVAPRFLEELQTRSHQISSNSDLVNW